jgi:malonyl-CoA O-methyltransferase
MNFSKNIKWSPSDYAKAAVLAREVGQEMLARLDWMTLKPRVIVDMGCGTGEMSALLQQRYPDAQVLALDMSQSMVQSLKQKAPQSYGICADGETLPLRNQTVDLIFANFLLPWHDDFTLLLREWMRVLRPEGLLLFTALGPDTLREWRAIFDDAHIPLLVDMHDIGDVLLKEGFADPVLDVDYYTMTYRDKNRLMSELRASGMLSSDQSDLCGVAPSDDGTWAVTYEVIHAHAFTRAASEEVSASADGIVRVPISHLRRQRSPEKGK